MIKGFIFDLDGVITDTANLHYKAWKNKVQELGIEYSESENEKLRGLPRKATLEAILKLKNPDIKLSEKQLDEICEAKNQEYIKLLNTEITQNSILPGIKKFLEQAKKNKIKIAIASSSYNAPLILKKLEVIDLFDYIVFPGDLKKGKPDPEIFLKAAEGLNLNVNECVGFEDAIAGIESIKAANMFSVAIKNGSSEDYCKADLILETTASLDFDFIIQKFS
ncbi:beta-phosphoglucomutase [Mycoplasma buteonis]|uniref:beta-phosphoglucomutase n=1 Tax=Mycoplasma buteonis TaxID=171280 RepID=UPI00056CB119|nr:beta-phosphoglucomutase [Mycoplasma buteonis]